MLPVLIIKTGETFPEIARENGDFERWIVLGFNSPDLNYRILDARKVRSFPDPGSISAVVITGSHAMITERHSWYFNLTDWIRLLRETSTPTLGICFGHQLLADTFGGKVDYNPAGREIGTQLVVVTPEGANNPLLRDFARTLPVQQSHAQRVRTLPTDAAALITNSHTPIQAFFLKPAIWGVQFHPEFSASIMQAYVHTLSAQLTMEGYQPDLILKGISETTDAQRIFTNFIEIITNKHNAFF